MVLTRASRPMVTRSRSKAPDQPGQLKALPKKRKANQQRSQGASMEAELSSEPVTPDLSSDSRKHAKPCARLTCNICLESVPSSKAASISECKHAFCKSCFKQLVRTALKDKAFPIKCPEVDCDCTLDLQLDIKPVFSSKKETKEYGELADLAAVSCIDEKDRFYCPNPACSALYQFTNLRVPPRCKDVSRACHECQENFCMRCQVPWHVTLSCTAFQALPAEERSSSADVQVHAMAKAENWKRCPSCRFFVERLEVTPPSMLTMPHDSRDTHMSCGDCMTDPRGTQ